jgi:hypothetical protein
MIPNVVPLSGSTAISGTGMNGAVAGLYQRASPWGSEGGAAGIGIGPAGTSLPASPGGGSAQQGVASPGMKTAAIVMTESDLTG